MSTICETKPAVAPERPFGTMSYVRKYEKAAVVALGREKVTAAYKAAKVNLANAFNAKELIAKSKVLETLGFKPEKQICHFSVGPATFTPVITAADEKPAASVAKLSAATPPKAVSSTVEPLTFRQKRLAAELAKMTAQLSTLTGISRACLAAKIEQLKKQQ